MKKTGLLLVNLGSPDSTSVSDVRRYLREFLMDGRVIDYPWLGRWLVVNLFVLPKRPKETAQAYKSIWTDEGSPLVVTSQKVRSLLQERLGEPVEMAMRYQNPSISVALDNLKAEGVTDLFLIPLFPHYAMSSFETAVERVKELITQKSLGMKMVVQDPYYADEDFVDALAASMQPHLEQPFDKLLFSYHGIPERHVKRTDPTKEHCFSKPDCCEGCHPAHAFCYRAQCYKTTEAVVKKLGLQPEQYAVSFQSRLGPDPWLKPFTDKEIIRFAEEGVKRLLVVCPAFVSDNLETIEEIGIRGKESFESAGGETLCRIPCMNEHPLWIDTLERMYKDWKKS
jgi:ferrochelatase